MSKLGEEPPGREHYEGVKPEWDTELGPEGDLGFAVVVHGGRTLVIPLHHVRTQIFDREVYRRSAQTFQDAIQDPPHREILVNVRGISDRYRVYDGTPLDFVNGDGHYVADLEQKEIEQIVEGELMEDEDE